MVRSAHSEHEGTCHLVSCVAVHMREVRSCALDDGFVEEEQGDDRREDDGEGDGAHHETEVDYLVCGTSFTLCKINMWLGGCAKRERGTSDQWLVGQGLDAKSNLCPSPVKSPSNACPKKVL